MRENPESIMSPEREPTMKLFHVSGFAELTEKEEGDKFVLTPGSNGAEGKGVYFAENEPRFSAAEGAQKGVRVVVVIETDTTSGWWRSKGYVVRKFGRPRTWHSDEKEISLKVNKAEAINDVKYLYCDWQWI